MNQRASRCWTLLLLSISPVNVQFAVPMYPPPPLPLPPPMPMPMFPPQGMIALAPMPPPMLIVPMEQKAATSSTTTTTTTTTTTERSMAIAVPVPVPLPVQLTIPGFPPPTFCYAQPRAANCPPCPPCQCQPMCTPSFFAYCSPCHLKCRCRSGDSVPVPLPPMRPQPIPGMAYPVPAPVPPYSPSVMVVPYPPTVIRPSCHDRGCRGDASSRDSSTDDSSSSSSSSGSDSSDKYLRQGPHQHRQRHGHRENGRPRLGHKDFEDQRNHDRHRSHRDHRGRRKPIPNYDNMGFRDFRKSHNNMQFDSSNELVRPVLSYINSNGDVKLQKRISKVDADKLMEDQDVDNVQTIHVRAEENTRGQAHVLTVSSDLNQNQENSNHDRHLILRRKMEPEVLHKGKKELHFKPPEDKRITNLSLSFHVT